MPLESLPFLAVALIIFSAITFETKRIYIALFLLFCAALVINVYMALLDPFLNPWDERFHALVAKNMIGHPLKPTLINNHIFSFDYRN